MACLSLLAASHSALAEGKIAVVDLQKAIFETQEAKSRIKAMQDSPDYIDGTNTLKLLSDEARGLKEKFDKDGAVMTANQKESLQREFNNALKDSKYEEDKLKKMGQEVYGQLMREMEPKLRSIMATVIKQQNIGLLLDRQAALHVAPEYDITPLITKSLNESK